MQLPGLIGESAGWIAYQITRLVPLLPTYSHLIVSALFPIYAGSHASLSRPSSAAKPKKKDKYDRDTDSDDEDEPEQRMEGLSPSDAIMFPVMAGSTLAGLYFLIKWLQDPALLNKLLNWYFASFSVISVSKMVSDGLDVFHSLLFPHDYLDRGVLFHVDPKRRRATPTTSAALAEHRNSPLPGPFSRLALPARILDIFWMLHVLPNRKLSFTAFVRRFLHVKLKLGIHGIEGLFVGFATVFYYNFVDKPWFLTNLMGFGFAYGALQLISPTTFWTGTLILSALFFYDIYFVFFTPLMVTVAKSLDIPIKLLFPRPSDLGADSAEQALSMLGLGDVVLPGMMIGLALRFDLFMFYLRKQTQAPNTLALAQDTSINKETSVPSVVEDESTSSSEIDQNAPVTPSETDTDATSPSATDPKSSPTVVKAPYQAVSEGWGDRLWTSSITQSVFNLLLFSWSPVSAIGTYKPRGAFPKPYFHASLIGYVTGMLVTLAAMQVSEHAQPALLYLVPGVVGSIWVKAWLKGEVKETWAFSDAREDEAAKKEKKKKKGESKPPNEEVPNDDEKEQGQDSTKNDKETWSRTTLRKSFFSMHRSDDRARNLQSALCNYAEEGKDDSDHSDDGKSDSSGVGEETTAAPQPRNRTLISFSVQLPPSELPGKESPSDGKKCSSGDSSTVAREDMRRWRGSSEGPSAEEGDAPSLKRQRVG